MLTFDFNQQVFNLKLSLVGFLTNTNIFDFYLRDCNNQLKYKCALSKYFYILIYISFLVIKETSDFLVSKSYRKKHKI